MTSYCWDIFSDLPLAFNNMLSCLPGKNYYLCLRGIEKFSAQGAGLTLLQRSVILLQREQSQNLNLNLKLMLHKENKRVMISNHKFPFWKIQLYTNLTLWTTNLLFLVHWITKQSFGESFFKKRETTKVSKTLRLARPWAYWKTKTCPAKGTSQ